MVVPRREVLRYVCHGCHKTTRLVQEGCVRMPELLKCQQCGAQMQLQPSEGVLQKLMDEITSKRLF